MIFFGANEPLASDCEMISATSQRQMTREVRPPKKNMRPVATIKRTSATKTPRSTTLGRNSRRQAVGRALRGGTPISMHDALASCGTKDDARRPLLISSLTGKIEFAKIILKVSLLLP